MIFKGVLIRRSWVVVLVAAGGVGCGVERDHDLGDMGAEPVPSEETVPAPPPLPPVAQHASEFVGTWVGSAEDPLAYAPNADDEPPPFRFPSGSTLIRLVLTMPPGEVFPSGTLTFGEAPPPPSDPDPDVGYPIEPDLSSATPVSDRSVRPAVEGFAYTLSPTNTFRDINAVDPRMSNFLREGLVADGKINLGYTPTEVFDPWCALQTAQSCPSDTGTTFYGDGTCSLDGEEVLVLDCMKAVQCASAVCSCEAEGACSASIQQNSSLTVRFSDGGLVGLFDGATFMNERGFQQLLGTVHLTREVGAAATTIATPTARP